MFLPKNVSLNFPLKTEFLVRVLFILRYNALPDSLFDLACLGNIEQSN